jgi:erythromycin esterase-like protein
LHEKKGFNVLAFESDFYGLTKGWDEVLKQPDSIRRFLNPNIFDIWTNSDACQYLFNTYIPNSFETNNPLQVTGFDSQVFLKYSRDHLKNDLNTYLTQNNLIPQLPGEANYQAFLNAVQTLLTTLQKSNLLQEGLTKIKEAQLQHKDSSYWSLIIDALISQNDFSYENRDRSMANNLKYLVNKKYKDEKIIVWAHNAHIGKLFDHVVMKPKYSKNPRFTIYNNMGSVFTKDDALATRTYIIGFASYAGKAGRLGTTHYQVGVPKKNGLENWIPKDRAYAFVDFKEYNKRFNSPAQPFLMKGPKHGTYPMHIAKVPWNLVYDGIFYIRDMYPVQAAR